MWTSRGQRAFSALPPPCPHSFTLCPHYDALAPLPTANACGATTTLFLNLKGQRLTTPTHTKRNRGQISSPCTSKALIADSTPGQLFEKQLRDVSPAIKANIDDERHLVYFREVPSMKLRIT